MAPSCEGGVTGLPTGSFVRASVPDSLDTCFLFGSVFVVTNPTACVPALGAIWLGEVIDSEALAPGVVA